MTSESNRSDIYNKDLSTSDSYNPTNITDWYDLNDIRNNPGHDYILITNLDSNSPGYQEYGKNWNPINEFTGTLDGTGHYISDITMGISESSLGIFENLSGKVANIHLTNIDLDSYSYSGTVAYRNEGQIINSSASGKFGYDNGRTIGGLVGINYGKVSNCYTHVKIENRSVFERANKMGGIVGRNEGTVSKCWASGSVDGSGNTKVGGICGVNYGTVNSSYWDVNTTNQDEGVGKGDDSGVTGLKTFEMQGLSAKEYMSALDFEGNWQVITDPDGYPTLRGGRLRSPPPTFDAVIAKSSGTISPGETVTLDASNSTGQINSYNWDFDDGTTATGQTVTHSYDTTGSYTVTLTITGDDATDTTTTEIVVESKDQLSFAVQPADPAVGEMVSSSVFS